MMNKITMLALILGFSLLVAAVSASAQCIDVTPASWDYGNVKVGTGESQFFTLHSCVESPVFIYAIEIVADPAGAFTIESSPAPGSIPGGEAWEVEVTFNPPSVGAHEAFLYIEHDAPGYEIYISLSGAGVRGWRCFATKAAP